MVVLCGFTCGKILFDVFPRTKIHVGVEQCSCFAPTKFECFMCQESIRNEFMPLGKDLLAAKLNYLQRGGGCCKKSEKK